MSGVGERSLRALAVLAVAVALMTPAGLGATPALGATPGVPSGARPVTSDIRLGVSAPIGNGFFVHFWVSPSTTGGTCYFNTFDHRLAAKRPSTWPPTGGGGCSSRSAAATRSEQQHAFRYVGAEWGGTKPRRERSKWVPPSVEGVLLAPATTARLVAKWPGGSHLLTLHGHYFAGGSPSMYGHSTSWQIVAYDRQGQIVAFWQWGR